MTTLKDCKVGDRIGLDHRIGLDQVVEGVIKQVKQGGSVLVGFAPPHICPFAWKIGCRPDDDPFLLSECTHGYLFLDNTPVQLIASATTIFTITNGGMACSGCGDWNDYGVPNAKDKYICYSCRGSRPWLMRT